MPHGAKKYEGEQITMLTFDDSYFLGETRDGFYIEPMMKCAWAAQLEVMCVIKQICEKYDIPYCDTSEHRLCFAPNQQRYLCFAVDQ